MAKLLETAEKKLITSIGYVGIDHYVDQKIMSPGGMSLNLAVHAKRLFGDAAEVVLAGVVGQDEKAKLIDQILLEQNIKNGLIKKEGATPTLSLRNNEVGEKVFLDFDGGVMIGYVVDSSQQELIRCSDIVATVLIKEVELLFSSLIAGAPIKFLSVDFSDLGGYKKDVQKVRNWMSEIDVAFFGLNISEKALIEELRLISKEFGKIVVVTVGEWGSFAFDCGKTFFAPAENVDLVVDTAGAGDAFAAMFLNALFSGSTVLQALEKSNSYSAKIVGQLGTY